MQKNDILSIIDHPGTLIIFIHHFICNIVDVLILGNTIYLISFHQLQQECDSFMNSSSSLGTGRDGNSRATFCRLSVPFVSFFAPSAGACTDDAWRSQQGERGDAKEGPASASQPSHDVQHCAVAFYVLVPHDPFARACQERFGSNGEHPFRMGVHDWGCGVPAEPDHGAPL